MAMYSVVPDAGKSMSKDRTHSELLAMLSLRVMYYPERSALGHNVNSNNVFPNIEGMSGSDEPLTQRKRGQ